MALPIPLPALSALLLTLLCIYKFLIYPLFLSPLSKIPAAHPLAAVSSLWIVYKRYSFCELATIHDAHQRLGEVVRLGPGEVSVNCVRGGIQTVYGGGFEKHDWYPNMFTNYGHTNMFSMITSKPHSIRKRMISATYSKTTLQSSAALAAQSHSILHSRFLPLLTRLASSNEPFNIFPLLSAITMDFVTCYLFGLSSGSNLLQKEEERNHFLHLYHCRRSYNFWPQEMPRMKAWLEWFGVKVVPSWVGDANEEIEKWTMGMVEGAERVRETGVEDVADSPTVYAQLAGSMVKASSSSSPSKVEDPTPETERLQIASELLDHLAAGFDTSGITLVYLIHCLSLRPKLQSALRAELLTLSPPILPSSSSPNLPSPKYIDALPLLNAIVQETLRLHAAIPGPQPRVTPASGCKLGGEGKEFWVPGGVRCSAQAWSLHRNGEVYADPGEWRPERWLVEEEDGELGKKVRFVCEGEMARWWWAFGSGGRMCVGSNLAIYQMKMIVAAIYTCFTTSIVDDEGIEQCDLYTAPPRGNKLMVKLEAV
ncbi:cytochrome P450 monooxygenase [Aulographum hederae CBS 113979]|uniref:Cytochrome P450 monooxygenase n=1 Tax=Aulographum hederae CBS 113979 TaxID=1176131 RepID=A0A6G1GTS5_9PEZI|nr:cytochrome P450 monooxygenase [Aulographum hederae CBS 113979]